MRTVVIVFLLGASLSAQRLSWQQEAEENPSSWTYRLYYDNGPTLVTEVVCNGTPPEFDCVAPQPERAGWVSAYLTVENSVSESLPSNPIYFSAPVVLMPARAPKNLKRLP